LKHGLIKKISKGKTPSGNYRRNIYQVIPIHMVKNTLSTGNIFSQVEEKITPNMGKKLPTNNTNLKHYQFNNNKEREDAAVVAVNFKKLKEKGEEKMRIIRERMVELGFKEKFIEKILKEYSTKKIDKKLDLLMEKKNIQNPAGWLSAALKNDYRGEEQEKLDSESAGHASHLSRIDSRFRGNDRKGSGNDISRGVLPYASPPNVITNSDSLECGNLNSLLPSPLEGEGQGEGDKILSTEEARERFKLLREKLMAMKSP